jgi:hypothetical protein
MGVDDSAGTCADGRGWNPAVVSATYRPGQSYTARGNRCFTATVSGATVGRPVSSVTVGLKRVLSATFVAVRRGVGPTGIESSVGETLR